MGEDGKAGVRGRVVSKQGQIIAKSLMAGFLGGVSEAFDVNPVPVVSTNHGSNTQYQSVFSDQMLQGAAVKGASKAPDRIAQFYIDMAEGIFPVIEVDAGRQVDIIVTKGTKLQIRSTGEPRNEKFEHFDQKGQFQRRGSKGTGSKIRKDVGGGCSATYFVGLFDVQHRQG